MRLTLDGVKRSRLLEAIVAYDNENPHYDETFDEVGARIRTAGLATKSDISTLVFWKRIRLGRWAGEFLQLSDSDVRRVTRTALAPDLEPAERLAAMNLPGLRHGGSVASTLLCAWNPLDFAVMDRRAWSAIGRLQLGDGKTYLGYLETVISIRDDLEQTRNGTTARDIDKGLFMLGASGGIDT